MTPRPTYSFKAVLSLIASLGLGGLLAACEVTTTEETTYAEQSAESLYNEAMNELMTENYIEAAELFEEVERQHPYSAWATKGQIMAAFAFYKKNEYDGAVLILNRFIQLHPSHVDTPYAYYLKALCYYERITDVSRDQKNTEMALEAFEELVIRFPNAKYAKNAELKLNLILSHLAGKNMTIGRYYLQRENYLAATNRFRSVVEEYETTAHIPEALHRMVEAYLALGMVTEARKVAAVLGHNFPDNPWHRDTYALLEENGLLKEYETLKSEVENRYSLTKKEGGEKEEEEKSYFSQVWDWVF
ncbi:MAG: outer membrane protein assembly factor BamD [Alphaproteobacteria bacterium]|jgi:outer membrane protein assembly factor BamD|nr:outer membrane protein assembly factor BamD [Alphaproteobacteria bacterium]MDP7190612.1 outer membrane protein assembly factor BamD [Alphaproteobacteria bacterium]HJO88656.1 outer membrane protein assembly factor BamD [Alphaproteobacteria bacterium]